MGDGGARSDDRDAAATDDLGKETVEGRARDAFESSEVTRNGGVPAGQQTSARRACQHQLARTRDSPAADEVEDRCKDHDSDGKEGRDGAEDPDRATEAERVDDAARKVVWQIAIDAGHVAREAVKQHTMGGRFKVAHRRADDGVEQP